MARLGHMDQGAREAAGRRKVRVREEEMARKEAVVFYAVYLRGRGAQMVGRLQRKNIQSCHLEA